MGVSEEYRAAKEKYADGILLFQAGIFYRIMFDDANAGVFAFNANNAPSNSNTNIGFRCGRGVWPDGAPSRRRVPCDPPYGRLAPSVRLCAGREERSTPGRPGSPPARAKGRTGFCGINYEDL